MIWCSCPELSNGDRYLELGYLREDQIAVVGYSKFDTINADFAAHPSLFPDDKPVVLYNPHPEPRLIVMVFIGLGSSRIFL